MPRSNRPAHPALLDKSTGRLRLSRRARREIKRIQAAQNAVAALGFVPLIRL